MCANPFLHLFERWNVGGEPLMIIIRTNRRMGMHIYIECSLLKELQSYTSYVYIWYIVFLILWDIRNCFLYTDVKKCEKEEHDSTREKKRMGIVKNLHYWRSHRNRKNWMYVEENMCAIRHYNRYLQRRLLFRRKRLN